MAAVSRVHCALATLRRTLQHPGAQLVLDERIQARITAGRALHGLVDALAVGREKCFRPLGLDARKSSGGCGHVCTQALLKGVHLLPWQVYL
jgi:hypothetical protein